VIKDSSTSTSSCRIKLLIVGLRVLKIQRPGCKGAKQPEGQARVTRQQCAEAEIKIPYKDLSGHRLLIPPIPNQQRTPLPATTLQYLLTFFGNWQEQHQKSRTSVLSYHLAPKLLGKKRSKLKLTVEQPWKWRRKLFPAGQ
jgi:hypothetical protein